MRPVVGHVVFYKGNKKRWYWSAVLANGNLVADNNIGYERIASAKKDANAALRVLASWARKEAKQQ